jgi:hypothetical protein
VDELVVFYERGQDLAKEGKVDEAAANYMAAFDLAVGPDAFSRRTLLANKLAFLYWNAGKDDLARPWYEVLGEPMPKRAPTTMPFKRALKVLKKAGLCSSLTPKLTKMLLEEVYSNDFDEEEAEVVPFLQAYYTSDDYQALKDGFIHHDWRFGHETSDAPAEFSQLVDGNSQLLKQIGYAPGMQSAEHSSSPPEVLTVERRNGERLSFPVQGLDDIAAAFNRELEKVGDVRRFVALQTDGDWHAYFLFDQDTFRILCLSKLPTLPCESVPGVDEKRWLNNK